MGASTPWLEPLPQKVSRLGLIHAGETTLKLRLVGQPGLTIDQNTTEADLISHECTMVDYTSGGYAITYVTGGITPGGVAYNFCNGLGFVVTDVTITNIIYGAWIHNTSGALQRVQFPTPVPLDAIGKQINITIYDGYPPGQVGLEVVLP